MPISRAPSDVPLDNLVAGSNILAVEVHQANSGSSDIVWAMQLDATVVQQDASLLNARDLFDNLRLTELMYNPLGGDSFEFIELQNIGDRPLNLAGVRLEEAVDFVFPDIVLPPEEYVVVVSNEPTFRQRHGDAVLVAGEFERNLSNRGEEVIASFAGPL